LFTLKQRALISAVIALGLALVLALWPMSGLRADAPSAPITLIANTWFGPAMLFLLPVLVSWVTFAAETSVGARFGFSITFALVVVCLFVIWFAKQVYRGYYGPIG
jgi:hypothetical protein